MFYLWLVGLDRSSGFVLLYFVSWFFRTSEPRLRPKKIMCASGEIGSAEKGRSVGIFFYFFVFFIYMIDRLVDKKNAATPKSVW